MASAFGEAHTLTLGTTGYGTDLLGVADKIGSQTFMDLSEPDGINMIAFTGGTTGRAKGVVRSNASMSAMRNSILADFGLPQSPRYLAVGPISHVTGTKIVPVLSRGGQISLQRKFDPVELLQNVERERINLLLAVPTMIYALLDCPDLAHRSLDSIDLILYGASPMSPSKLDEALERIGPVFGQLYGQTECYPVTFLGPEDHRRDRPDLLAACGFPASCAMVALLDDKSVPVPRGEIGEICVRSPAMMSEYWREPALTQQALSGGWLHTGDLAREDDQGRLFIVDRKKDMIISGGFNVYPKEVEDVLSRHPAVAMAAVIGVPDQKWGERVHAVVTLRPGKSATEAELIGFVRAEAGTMIAPKSVDFVGKLSLTGAGKIDKKALRRLYWSDASRQIG